MGWNELDLSSPWQNVAGDLGELVSTLTCDLREQLSDPESGRLDD